MAQFIGFEKVAVGDTVITESDFTIPSGTMRVHIQATTAAVAYTMDNSTDPDEDSGMVLVVGHVPLDFNIDDFLRIRLHRNTSTDGAVQVHYFGMG